MKKIITAINNPNLNEKLKQENNLEIICKDIQYKEAILEILLENKNVDILIINNDLPGEIQTEKLLNEIKVINNKIKIIFILEKENKKIEIISGLKNYFNNQINNIEKINLNIFEIFKYLKNIYDFILIDIGTENKKEINNILIKNSDLNFLLIEGNLIGINKAKILINNLYDKNNFNLIINKKDKYCVDLKILNIIFENKNKIQIVKYNKYFSNLINKNFKNIYLNKKINLEKIYKNIINKIII